MSTTLNKMIKRRRDLRAVGDKGFTLIELLVVILIIGILSAIVVIALTGTNKDASAKACSQDAANLYSAMTNYQLASGGGNGSFPAATGAALGTAVAGVTIPNVDTTKYPNFYFGATYQAADLAILVPTYISKIPTSVTPYLITMSGATAGTMAVFTGGASILAVASSSAGETTCIPAGI